MTKPLQSLSSLIISQRDLIWTLAKREIRSQYIGSHLGFLWSIINPLVMVSVFWFVFSVGFKSKPMNDVPFVVWLVAGLAAWNCFAEIISSAGDLVVSNAQLIKKTRFKADILPIVKIVACSITHLIFLLILLALLAFQSMPFSFFYFQAIYYFICLSVLTLGLSWAISALNVFTRDVGKIVGVLLQLGFWATPVFWELSIMPESVQRYIRFNPMHYIVQGYRDSFIYFVPFWSKPKETLSFWGCALVCIVLGRVIFGRLKPQFADVL